MCYCPLTYDDNHILVMLYITMSYIIVLLTNFESVGSLVFSVKIFQFSQKVTYSLSRNIDQQQHFKFNNSYYFKVVNTKSWINIRGQPIVMIQIFNQTETDRLEVNYGNALLYTVSVIDCLRPGSSVLCILIVDIILKSALILFSLLRVSNYHYNKGPLKVQFIG